MAQNSKKSLNQYTGTWSVIQNRSINNTQKRAGIFHFWKVHRINTLTNEIEITQIGYGFDDEVLIDEPKKITYKFALNSADFSIILDGHQPNSQYKLRLCPLPADNAIILKGSFERLDKKTENKAFVFGKINEDTSVYVKPEGEIEVVIQPPPPIE